MEPRRPQRKKATREKPQKEPAACPPPPAAAAASDEEDVEVGGAPGGVAGEEKKLRGSSSSSSSTTIVPAAAAAPKRVPAAPPCCQVEECAADLKEAKRYHRRHKVCEVHSKASVVIVAGLRQRFCQQCSRFHELSEFDDAKRSCRRRLAGHNERRRKSSSDPQGDGLNRCRPADHEGRIQMSSDSGNPTYKHFQIR